MSIKQRISWRDDEGKVQTAALAALVGIMITAAAVALILLSFNDSSSDGGQPANQAAAAQVTDTPSATESATASQTAAPSSSAASAKPKATSKPKANSKPAPTSKPAAKPASSAKAKPASKPKASTATTKTKTKTYIVKSGDNLTAIADWFNQRGYGTLYDWNKTVIGKNPNLIYPGQKIIVSTSGVAVANN